MTAVLDLRHATKPKHRDSIMGRGLQPHTPGRDGNWPFFDDEQPRGVYLFNPDIVGRCESAWDLRSSEDLWSVSYFGPLQPDPLIGNAVIAPDPIVKGLRLEIAA
jgi:hypothetical protein